MKNQLLALFALVSLLSACQTENSSGTTEYEVVFRESEAGAYTKQAAESGQYEYAYNYTDRGRGPEYKETISLDAQGFIEQQLVHGVNYLKDSIREEFVVEGENGKMLNPLGENTKAYSGEALYFRFDGSPAVFEILANLLQHTNQKVALFPEGEAELLRTLPMTIAGHEVQLLMVNGLDIDPVYIWMEGDEMIAKIQGNLHVVRKDLISARPEMKAIQDSLENEYLFEKTKKLTHGYTKALIKNVNVFTPDGQVLSAQDVLVNGEKIEAISPTGRLSADADMLILDGNGKFLMPGMFDMHTHNNKFRGAMYLAGGVTAVRDLANNKQLVDLIAQFDKNEIMGPRIVYRCGIIDGSGPYANKRNVVNTLEEGLREVQAYKDLGYQQIKLYSSIRPEWVEPLIAKSHELGMKVSGHIPAFMTASQAIEQGFDEIQHTNMLFLNFMSDTVDTRTPLRFTMVGQYGRDIDLQAEPYLSFANTLLKEGIIVDPTLAIFENMFIAQKGEPSPTYEMIMDRFPIINQRTFLSGGLPKDGDKTPIYQESYQRMLDMVFDLYQRGVTIVAGTDGLPGFLYHRELELYHRAGISNVALLKMATLESAKVAGVDETLGSIEIGKLADLILVDGNPMQDISDLRKVEWTLKGGNIFYAKEIYESMGIQHFK